MSFTKVRHASINETERRKVTRLATVVRRDAVLMARLPLGPLAPVTKSVDPNRGKSCDLCHTVAHLSPLLYFCRLRRFTRRCPICVLPPGADGGHDAILGQETASTVFSSGAPRPTWSSRAASSYGAGQDPSHGSDVDAVELLIHAEADLPLI
jgi:hypothetical protein